MASILDEGLGYKPGTGTSPDVAAAGAFALPAASRALGFPGAGPTRPRIGSPIDAPTPFTDGGWTAQ